MSKRHGGVRDNAGRPGEGRAAGGRLQVYLEPWELDRIREIAKAAGVTASAWAADVLSRAIRNAKI